MTDIADIAARARAEVVAIGSEIDPADAARAAREALSALKRRQTDDLLPVNLGRFEQFEDPDSPAARMLRAVRVISCNGPAAIIHETHFAERRALQSAELDFEDAARLLDQAIPLVVERITKGRRVSIVQVPQSAIERLLAETLPTAERPGTKDAAQALLHSVLARRDWPLAKRVVEAIETSLDKADVRAILKTIDRETLDWMTRVLLDDGGMIHLPVANVAGEGVGG